jgi:hypothetical protein
VKRLNLQETLEISGGNIRISHVSDGQYGVNGEFSEQINIYINDKESVLEFMDISFSKSGCFFNGKPTEPQLTYSGYYVMTYTFNLPHTAYILNR